MKDCLLKASSVRQFLPKQTIMKRFLFAGLLCTALAPAVFAQPSNDNLPYKNEFGVDATSFVRQFFKISSAMPGEDYSPTYYLTYRRLTTAGNLRAAIGGSFNDRLIQPSLVTDSNKYYMKSSAINFRVGWEFFTNITKRWQTFYGMDFCPTIIKNRNDAHHWNGGYATGSESNNINFAVAPLLGFRYRITDRISIATETSFSFNWTAQKSRQYYTPVDPALPAKPDKVEPRNVMRSTRYQQPIGLFFMVNL